MAMVIGSLHSNTGEKIYFESAVLRFVSLLTGHRETRPNTVMNVLVE